MNDSGNPYGLLNMLLAAREQLTVLAMSGVAGAFFRVLIAPEKDWQRRIVQGVAGAVSAMFLGGILAYVIDNVTSAGVFAYLAGGFIMGSGGEIAVKRIQDRFLGPEKNKDEKP